MKPALPLTLALTLALGACSSYREAKISEQFQMNYDEVVPARVASPDGALGSVTVHADARLHAGLFDGDGPDAEFAKKFGGRDNAAWEKLFLSGGRA